MSPMNFKNVKTQTYGIWMNTINKKTKIINISLKNSIENYSSIVSTKNKDSKDPRTKKFQQQD